MGRIFHVYTRHTSSCLCVDNTRLISGPRPEGPPQAALKLAKPISANSYQFIFPILILSSIR
ncbi:hypothetical protein PEC311524_40960 [Pectobacterium carotovorum subsp. carotovorum]|nr:hypothetical protein PEC311524_40960 [Pectobacterium carotovorum subsp. carotovorum]